MYITPRIAFSDESVMTLQNLLEVHSSEILKDHRKLKDMLKYNDKEGEFSKEIYLLSISMIANIPEQILAYRTDFARIFHLLVQQLRGRFLIEEQAAQWAVSSWAKALEKLNIHKKKEWMICSLDLNRKGIRVIRWTSQVSLCGISPTPEINAGGEKCITSKCY